MISEAAQQAAVSSGIPAEAMGLLAFAALMTLLFVTFAFRSVGSRH